MREDAFADQADQPGEQDAGGYGKRRGASMRLRPGLG